MDNSHVLPRTLVMYGIVVCLAAFIGLAVANPGTLSIAAVGLICVIIALPLIIRWHYLFLLLSWNAAVCVFFLPGRPALWMLMSGISLGIAIVTRLVTHRSTFINVPSITWPLIVLAIVVLVTAYARGGIGFQSLGASTFGGRRYVNIVAAVIGFFALVNCQIPMRQATFSTAAFFLPGLTAVVSNLIYLAGPALYFLYWIFPADLAHGQAFVDYTVGNSVRRLAGFAPAGSALLSVMLFRYGLRGVLDITKPWRLLLLAIVLATSLFGGYRSSLVMFAIVFALQFYFERLYRTKLLLVIGIVAVITAAILPFTADKLPLSFQRSISFLPIKVDPVAKFDAYLSTDWRLRMWKLLVPDIPKYLLLGKGYALDPTEMYLLQWGVTQGYFSDVDLPIMVGNYHNGPLTLLIPFGLGGTLAFVWFGLATVRLLYRNYRYGPPELKTINTFLLCYFSMRLLYFMTFWGQIVEDFFILSGVAGLAIALNGGMHRPEAAAPVTEVASVDPELQPVPA